jgi:predicted nucleic acid-binding protein
MLIQTIVPDASVLLKWALRSDDEADTDNALTILSAWLEGRIRIILPQLWAFEVGNVLMMKNPALADEIMEVLLGYDFEESETTMGLCREAFALMRQYKVTFYDAAYHAVAILNNGSFVTADEAYVRRATGRQDVMALKDWT